MIDYWRQLDFVGPSDLTFEVSIIGVGGLGSPIALALAKMGCSRLVLIDPDTVEPHNLPNQLYRRSDIDRPKVEALASILGDYTDASIEPIRELVSDRQFSGVVVSAVDNMAARQRIWDACIRYRASVLLYVDARLGGEVGRVLTVHPADPLSVAAYETTLYTDDTASIEPCTAQSTIYTTFGIAALVANQVKRYAKAEELLGDQVLDFATSTLLGSGGTS
jgi:molybdopterin/thiamine biosynthesis adenylyltransferase